MNFLETFDLAISTLSPVHVGCGEDYEPTGFVVHNEGLHPVAPEALIRLLDAQDVAELEACTEDHEAPILKVRKFLAKRALKLAGDSGPCIPVVPAFARQYREQLDRPATREGDGSAVINRLAIERTSKGLADGLPFLPGSSIKGAIRTAWLNRLNEKREPAFTLKTLELANQIGAFNGLIELREVGGREEWRLKNANTLDAFRTKAREYKRALKDLEKGISDRASQANIDLLEMAYQGKVGFERDPLRLLKVSDAVCRLGENGGFQTGISYCVNRSRGGRKSQAQQRQLTTRLEAVLPYQGEAFIASVGLQGLGAHGGSQTPARHLRPTFAEIAQACNDYYLPRLEAEITYLRQTNLAAGWAQVVGGFLNRGLRDALRVGEQILIRIGKHSGADSLTLDAARSIKIMLNKHEFDTNNKLQLWAFDTAPRTSWFAAPEQDTRGGMLPYGWLLLSPKALPDGWKETLREAANQHIAVWFGGYVESRAREQAAHAKALERARQEADEATQQAEKQARLDSLTPNQRRIEEFVMFAVQRDEQLRGGREKLNADFHGRARKLATDALEEPGWSAQDKRAAADAIAEWLPKVVERIDKDQIKKLKLGALRSASE